jgi:hypothetical protein
VENAINTGAILDLATPEELDRRREFGEVVPSV